MKIYLTLFILSLSFTFLYSADSAASVIPGKLLLGGFSKGIVVLADGKGKIDKQIKVGRCVQDVWLLPDGKIAASYIRGFKIFDKDGKVVGGYTSKEKSPIEVHSLQPIADNLYLVCECGSKRLLEVTSDGKIQKVIKLSSPLKPHLQFRAARKTVRGTYWVAFLGDSNVCEIDSNGKVLRKIKVSRNGKSAHAVIELPNGHILVSTGYSKGIKEFDKNGKLVWSVSPQELVNAGIKRTGYAAGLQRLPNGNTLLAVYHGNPQIVEITPDKKIVWSFFNPSLGNIANINNLDGQDGTIKTRPLR